VFVLYAEDRGLLSSDLGGSWREVGGNDFTGRVRSPEMGEYLRRNPSVAPESAMDFPISELMDEDACYAKLLSWLHPDGLACPRCGARDGLGVHRRHRAPVLDYRCAACKRVFNAFTGTLLQGTQRRPVALVLILRGVAQGASTARLARELGCDRRELLDFRHRVQHAAWLFRDQGRLKDRVVEADEMYQNAGEKRRAAHRPRGPAATAGQ
jgi:transposase-like protein